MIRMYRERNPSFDHSAILDVYDGPAFENIHKALNALFLVFTS